MCGILFNNVPLGLVACKTEPSADVIKMKKNNPSNSVVVKQMAGCVDEVLQGS